MIAHGYVRATKNLDLWILADAENVRKVAAVLNQFFGSTLPPERLLSPRLLLRVGVPPAQVEITTHIDGVTYAECRSHAMEVEMDGVRFFVLSLDDLRRNKAGSGRPQDLGDLDNLPPTE